MLDIHEIIKIHLECSTEAAHKYTTLCLQEEDKELLGIFEQRRQEHSRKVTKLKLITNILDGEEF